MHNILTFKTRRTSDTITFNLLDNGKFEAILTANSHEFTVVDSNIDKLTFTMLYKIIEFSTDPFFIEEYKKLIEFIVEHGRTALLEEVIKKLGGDCRG